MSQEGTRLVIFVSVRSIDLLEKLKFEFQQLSRETLLHKIVPYTLTQPKLAR